MSDAGTRWISSYRVRLAVGYLLIVALIGGTWVWSLFAPLTDAVVRQEEEHLQAVAQAGAVTLEEADVSIEEFTRRMVSDTNLRVTIVASDGVVLADSAFDPASMENHADRPEVATALRGGIGKDRRVSETQGLERVYVAVPASYSGRDVVLRVSASMPEIDRLASQARRTGLLLVAGALIVALVVSLRLTAIASEPIARLTDAADAMARGDLSATVPQEVGELSVLSSALLRLREQIRRRLEDLEAEKRNLGTVLDGLEDAVLLLEGDAVAFANEAANRLFREPRGGWRGRPLDRSGLPASVAGVIARHLETRSAGAEECGPDPTGRTLRVSVLPLPNGETPRALVAISDITERARLERVRRDFVANASHELKTPVSALHLLAESAADAASTGDIETALAFTRQIADESARLGRLVQDLLDLSRLEASPAPGTVTDMRTAIDDALLSHGAAAIAKGLRIALDDSSARGCDAYVIADPTDVAVLLDNLLDNAVKYTERGSVTVSLGVKDEEVLVAVIDTGIGIPSQDLSRIFERFYRVDRARSRESGGTGLGLALVRHVVERAGGTIEVSSEPGHGSTFRVALPRARWTELGSRPREP